MENAQQMSSSAIGGTGAAATSVTAMLGTAAVLQLPPSHHHHHSSVECCLLDREYLTISGGGVKCKAYCGVLLGWEAILTLGGSKNGFGNLKGFAGASAGAMYALMLSIGMSAEQIFFEALEADMSAVHQQMNLLRYTKDLGAVPNGVLVKSVETVLDRMGFSPNITLEQLYCITHKELEVCVTNTNEDVPEMWSHRTRPSYRVAHAVATSMSFPILFTPTRVLPPDDTLPGCYGSTTTGSFTATSSSSSSSSNSPRMQQPQSTTSNTAGSSKAMGSSSSMSSLFGSITSSAARMMQQQQQQPVARHTPVTLSRTRSTTSSSQQQQQPPHADTWRGLQIIDRSTDGLAHPDARLYSDGGVSINVPYHVFPLHKALILVLESTPDPVIHGPWDYLFKVLMIPSTMNQHHHLNLIPPAHRQNVVSIQAGKINTLDFTLGLGPCCALVQYGLFQILSWWKDHCADFKLCGSTERERERKWLNLYGATTSKLQLLISRLTGATKLPMPCSTQTEAVTTPGPLTPSASCITTPTAATLSELLKNDDDNDETTVEVDGIVTTAPPADPHSIDLTTSLHSTSQQSHHHLLPDLTVSPEGTASSFACDALVLAAATKNQ